MHATNKVASKDMIQKLIELQGEIDKSPTIVGDLDVPILVTNRSSRQKISKNIVDLNSTINQPNLIDIYRIFHSTTKYTYPSSSHGIFTKICHILGYKTHPKKF